MRALPILLLTAALAGQQGPTPTASPTTIDLGVLHTGAVAEGTVHIYWGTPKDDRKAVAQLPKVAKQLRLTTEKGHEDNAESRLGFAVATDAVGKVDTNITLRLGDLRSVVRLTYEVVPAVPKSSRILVASSPFMGDSSDDPKTFARWRSLVADSRLDVDYRFRRKDAPPFTAAALARADIVVAGEGALAGITANEVARLQGFVCGGGRVIICANRFFRTTVEKANLICKPFGLSMLDREPNIGPALVSEEEDQTRHPLSVGVEEVSVRRPSPTTIDDEARAAPLIVLPVLGPELPFAAIATTKSGGELITVGESLWWNWVGQGKGNARLLRNLLVRAPRMR